MKFKEFSILLLSSMFLVVIISSHGDAPWRWVCVFEKCLKTRIAEENNITAPILGLDTCKMFCEKYGLLWPRPTGHVDLGTILLPIDIHSIEIIMQTHGQADHLMEGAAERFRQIVNLVIPDGWISPTEGRQLDVYLVNHNPNARGFSLRMNESYTLNISLARDGNINATISASCFFGVRHGLETLSQLIIYDDVRNLVLIARDVAIDDQPKYPYRGIMVDTARSYYTVQSIKRTIDAMAAVKLNTFHWHITDTQSFPFVSERRPELSNLGAYSPTKVYTKRAIREVVQYGYERGVRILPEFDGPAHAGEGWQESNLTLCFKAEPWYLYCKEPPCGQLNPVRPLLYEYLADIYTDMAEAFQSDMFHMGGNEVSESCWASYPEIRDYVSENILRRPNLYKLLIANHRKRAETTFKKLWSMYQNRSQEKLYKAFGKKLPIVLWSSTLTDPQTIRKFLNKTKYIIQVWAKSDQGVVSDLLEKGYPVILSHQDYLFFTCGLSSWLGTGFNWCSPYKGWKEVYVKSPRRSLNEASLKLVLGAEACIWSEQTDSATLDSRLWPRAAALAERLWADPDIPWSEAEARILRMRERLFRMGVNAEVVQPEWCYQNDGACYGRASPLRFVEAASILANILFYTFCLFVVNCVFRIV